MVPTVSILVPVFNVEKYIRKSINSILNQSFSDFELILVNDGTPDSSAEICEEYAQKDSRVKVIHKENEGFYSARNVGLSLAKGKYVYFMDSDDWLEHDLLRDNIAIAEKENADVVFFGHFRDMVGKGSSVTNEVAPSQFLRFAGINHSRLFQELQRIIGMALWQMLIKREVIESNNLLFPTMKREPDMYFIVGLYSNIKGNIVFNPKSYYHHLIIRSTSKLNLDSFENHKKIYNRAFCNFFQPLLRGNARNYLAYLLVTWFAHSVPNGIVANREDGVKEKLKKIKSVIADPQVTTWNNSFALKDADGVINKLLLILLKLQSPVLLFTVISIKRFFFNNVKVDFRKSR